MSVGRSKIAKIAHQYEAGLALGGQDVLLRKASTLPEDGKEYGLHRQRPLSG